MFSRLVLDSSVVIAAADPAEPSHLDASGFLDRLAGPQQQIAPRRRRGRLTICMQRGCHTVESFEHLGQLCRAEGHCIV